MNAEEKKTNLAHTAADYALRVYTRIRMLGEVWQGRFDARPALARAWCMGLLVLAGSYAFISTYSVAVRSGSRAALLPLREFYVIDSLPSGDPLRVFGLEAGDTLRILSDPSRIDAAQESEAGFRWAEGTAFQKVSGSGVAGEVHRNGSPAMHLFHLIFSIAGIGLLLLAGGLAWRRGEARDARGFIYAATFTGCLLVFGFGMPVVSAQSVTANAQTWVMAAMAALAAFFLARFIKRMMEGSAAETPPLQMLGMIALPFLMSVAGVAIAGKVTVWWLLAVFIAPVAAALPTHNRGKGPRSRSELLGLRSWAWAFGLAALSLLLIATGFETGYETWTGALALPMLAVPWNALHGVGRLNLFRVHFLLPRSPAKEIVFTYLALAGFVGCVLLASYAPAIFSTLPVPEVRVYGIFFSTPDEAELSVRNSQLVRSAFYAGIVIALAVISLAIVLALWSPVPILRPNAVVRKRKERARSLARVFDSTDSLAERLAQELCTTFGVRHSSVAVRRQDLLELAARKGLSDNGFEESYIRNAHIWEKEFARSIRPKLAARLFYRHDLSDVQIVAPMIVDGKLEGLIFLGPKTDGSRYVEEDMELLDAYVDAASSGLKMTHALQTQDGEVSAFARKSVAGNLRRMMSEIELSDVPGFDCAFESLPSGGLSTDFFETVAHFDRVGVFLGSITGKGLESVLLLATLKGMILSMGSFSPGFWDFFVRIRSHLHFRREDYERCSFVGLCLSLAYSKAVFVRAGGPPLILYRADSRKVEFVNPPGDEPGAGETSDAEHPQEEVVMLNAGDVMVLTTEGADVLLNEAGEVFGIERVAVLLRECAALSAQEILQTVITEQAAFHGDAKPAEDRTFLVIKKW